MCGFHLFFSLPHLFVSFWNWKVNTIKPKKKMQLPAWASSSSHQILTLLVDVQPQSLIENYCHKAWLQPGSSNHLKTKIKHFKTTPMVALSTLFRYTLFISYSLFWIYKSNHFKDCIPLWISDWQGHRKAVIGWMKWHVLQHNIRKVHNIPMWSLLVFVDPMQISFSWRTWDQNN